MSDANDPNAAPQERLPTRNWRFDFASYAETRHFLDRMADLSRREDYYPNVSFGKTYVNISIDADGQVALAARNSSFIGEMEALATANKA
jgi:pterin-4a-carbinolamine dehydratase